ncbi:hypothetical protein PYCC9005_005373 [Savitreella phatthalungensis]
MPLSASADVQTAWQHITDYLGRSPAACNSSSIRQDMALLPARAVYAFYEELVRTTFALKIAPALSQVPLNNATLLEVVSNLREGLARYQHCLDNLDLPRGMSIAEPFDALIRNSINRSSLRKACRDRLRTGAADVRLIAGLVECGLLETFAEEVMHLIQSEILACRSLITSGTLQGAEALFEELKASAFDRLELLGYSSNEMTLEDEVQIALTCTRIEQLFELVVDYPDSHKTLEALRSGLSGEEKLRTRLVATFVGQCEARLLHPGANTATIIDFYVSTIRAMLVLDGEGILLEHVARPIRKYLRDRGDTIRTIMASLIGEDSSLGLQLGETKAPLGMSYDPEEDLEWKPNPIDAPGDYLRGGAIDIISSLTTIYDNKDIFVRELQQLLAARLLASPSYDISRDVRDLEMLKARFGESKMAACDVMLRDIADSGRLDGMIHAADERVAERMLDGVHFFVLSRLYWPNIARSIMEEPLILPKPLQAVFQMYDELFRGIKSERRLFLLPSAGNVRLTLDFADRTLDVVVSPVHATVIYAFEGETTLQLIDIARKIGRQPVETRRLLDFWTRQGVLQVTAEDEYTILEEQPAEGFTASIGLVEMSAAEPDEEDSLEAIWPFVVAMLTNLGQLPMERINSMLGMFAGGSYTGSIDDLREFLSKKSRSGLLEFKAGQYKLPT